MNGAPVVCGLAFGLGVLGLVMSRRTEGRIGGTRARITGSGIDHRHVALVALATGVGAAAVAVTGWPVALPITALAVVGVPNLIGRTSGSVSIAKVEAIAAWTEMLQGTMAASAGLGQAIMSTAPLSPTPIHVATTRLSARLGAGMHPREALVLFADEVQDPCSDRVVCALLLATSARAQRLGDLLADLADSTREEVALRLRIETSRASVRSGVRTVVVFSIAFAVTLTLLARSYLQPFSSLRGQVVLLAVGALYAIGLTSMVALARPPAPLRLLGRQVVGR